MTPAASAGEPDDSGLARFNSLSSTDAAAGLYSCFAHRGWADRVAAGRPYGSREALNAAAERAWAELRPQDWLEAFRAHPRIGERGGHSPEVSEREQRGVTLASRDTLEALARENQRYEERFGHVFLIAAAGRSADEILAELRRRVDNDPAGELAEAASEQRRITRLRIEMMLEA